MQLAVLSDIHSNHHALQACLAHAVQRGADAFLFLGDYVGELAYPQKTMELLYRFMESHDCRFIRGNREDYWAEYEARGKTGWKATGSTTGCLYYAYHNLTERDLAFFRSLPHAAELTLPGLPSLTLCHGSPSKTKEQLLPDTDNTLAALDKLPTNYLLCGHTHLPCKVQHAGKTLLNPGSVGMTHSCAQTQYLLLDGTAHGWQEIFVQLNYDVEAVIREMHESGLSQRAPYWCLTTEHMLRGGDINHSQMLIRAMEICREQNGVCKFPKIPEVCWAQAAQELLR